MCGIAGFLDFTAEHQQRYSNLVRMLASITHRGPDDQGCWLEGPIALGHRRLSIVDLSSLGHQPMESLSRRFVIVFNGEIYNHSELRCQLEAEGYSFHGHSDTEVLLSLIEKFGLEHALKKSIGMFAIALWDRKDRTLQLARDRFGEKPLFYTWHKNKFLFGSELKALIAHEAFERSVDTASLAEFLRYGYIPSPHCIYQKTFKLEPGHILTLKLPSNSSSTPIEENCKTTKQAFWRHEDVLMQGLEQPYEGSYQEATDHLEALLINAVGLQMQADVPWGAFLSGGIDSSTVVALMQRQSTQAIRTYSIGFEVESVNEAEHAKAVACHLGTNHTEFYLSSADALNIIPSLSNMYDEPLGDSSQIPTYLVAKLAQSHVTVALSGDGGDELFYGYQKYIFGQCFANLMARKKLGQLINWLPWKTIENAAKLLPKRVGQHLKASRFQTLHRLLSSPNHQGIAEIVSTICPYAEQLVPGSIKRPTAFTIRRPTLIESDYRSMAMLLDRETYLPDDVLTKVDRATMSVGLESRAPLLDHRIAEFAATLPMSFLVQGAVSKRILRDVLYRHVPQALVDRPKVGFSIPIAQWLRKDLNSWANDLLSSHKAEGLLDMSACRRLFKEHESGGKDLSALSWNILTYLAWTEKWV